MGKRPTLLASSDPFLASRVMIAKKSADGDASHLHPGIRRRHLTGYRCTRRVAPLVRRPNQWISESTSPRFPDIIQKGRPRLKIGIVGSDNSHAIAYSKLINVDRLLGDAARVFGIWGQDPVRTQEVATTGQIATIVEAPDGLLGKVDTVFVVDRHGDLHADHALPYLEAGIPVYVDKPFAISLPDCRRMLDAASKSGAFVTSMSSLRITPETTGLANQIATIGDIRAAQFAGPCDFSSEYGGPFFYATHVLEIALRLLSDEVKTIQAERAGQTVVVNAVWANDRQATLTYLGDAHYHFHATLFGTEGMVSGEIHANTDGYAEIVKQVLAAIEANARPLSDRQLLLPIAAVHAIQTSLKEDGKSIAIDNILA